MSVKHPIVAITGSSGAGTSTVTKSFDLVFRREKLKAAIVEGDSFHRYDRKAMKIAMEEAREGQQPLQPFRPRSQPARGTGRPVQDYGEDRQGQGQEVSAQCRGGGALRPAVGRVHALGRHPRRHRPDVLRRPARRRGHRQGQCRQHADLLVGVVPTVNLEWIQKLHRDKNQRGYSTEAVVDTILRRMPDYINYITPQFSRTHVNFQRVPTVDTSNPFIARDIPTADESFVVIRFANSKGIDFPYLLSMIHDSFMSRPNIIVVPGGKMELAMQLIFTPLILRMMENRKRA
jgi:phosphoribulokinase